MDVSEGDCYDVLVYSKEIQNQPEEEEEKLKRDGYQMWQCLQEDPRPPTPENIKKFRTSLLPEPGAIRIEYGKVNDPDVANTLVHGVLTKESIKGGSLIHPPKKTIVQNKLEEISEAVNPTLRKAPIGGAWTKHRTLPSWFNNQTTFGVETVRGESVYKIILPPKPREEVEKEAVKGHELYVRSHNDYYIGERINRNYEWNLQNPDSVFGTETPNFPDGRKTVKNLQWEGEDVRFSNPKPIWKRNGNSEELALDNGQILHKSTLPVPPDHTFGMAVPEDHFGVGETIHSTQPGEFARDRDHRRSLVNAVRHHIKMLNFRNFPCLLNAFKYYDKKGNGMIDRQDLEAVCEEFQLGLSNEVVDDLMEACDADRDGFLNFKEFANFLNWKDMTPIESNEESILTAVSSTEPDPRPDSNSCEEPETQSGQIPTQPLLEPDDLMPFGVNELAKTVKTIGRMKQSPDHFKTSSSAIGDTTGAPHPSCIPTYGIPTVRLDLPVPRIKSIGDTKNYGDASTAVDLLTPSIYTGRGIYEEDFLCPRSKTEIAEIFRNVCPDLTGVIFEEAWSLACSKAPDESVSVGSFRSALAEINFL